MPADPRGLFVRLSLSGIPEVEALVRSEVARRLREMADDEPSAVAARLRQIADECETGVGGDVSG